MRGQPVDCWIGLGSNVGDRFDFLRAAGQRLRETPGIDLMATSSVYETEPWGYPDQPRFLNAVARVRTTLGPVQLLLRLQTIERDLGRTPTFRWGPREIDLDVLQYGDAVVSRRGFRSPHPALEKRAFVLVPLREVSPDFRLLSGKSIDDALAGLDRNEADVRLFREAPGPLVR